MGLRPAKCYRDITNLPYTRKANRVMKKSFVRGVPGSKIALFDMGNKSKREWVYSVDLVSEVKVQLRHNQLEAARMSIFRDLTKNLGNDKFFFRIRSFPHHVLRENPMATGAGADRFQTGMSNSFGKPIGVAARVKPGKSVMSVYVDSDKLAPKVKMAYNTAVKKMSGKFSIKINTVPDGKV